MKDHRVGQFKAKLALGLSVTLLGAAALVLNGCQSNIPEVATTTHGANAGDGYTYGTGPNKTRPYPQSDPVNINGVGGATPKYEPLSRGGNKDYTVLGQNYTLLGMVLVSTAIRPLTAKPTIKRAIAPHTRTYLCLLTSRSPI